MPSDPKPPPTAIALVVCAVFFLSGASALILEIAWTRQLELLLGNGIHAATTMIAVYMLGLGLGARFGGRLAKRAVSPMKTYAILEVLIIAWALAIPLLFKALYALFPLLTSIPGLASPAGTPTLLRLAASLIIFAAPTLLMGATLPVLTHAIAARAAGFATRFSFLYGANTLGAVAGSLGAGFALLPRFGITQTVLLALTLNAVAGVAALLLARKLPFIAIAAPAPAASPVNTDTASKLSPRTLTALAAAAGFLALYLEIFWFRSLILVFGSTTYSLSAMLGIFLAGTACGPLLLGWIGDRAFASRRMPVIAGLCFFTAGIAVVLSVNVIGQLPDRLLARLAANEFSWKELVTSKFILSFQIIFLPALLLGAVLPLCAKAIRGAQIESAAAAARIYLANTFGATAGAILGGLVFIPLAGLYYGILGAGVACLIVGILSVALDGSTPRLRAILPVFAIFLALTWFVFKEPWDLKKFALGAYFHPGMHSETGRVRFEDVLKTSTLRVYEEGVTATIAVLESHDDSLRYTSNGKVEADSKPRGMINQRLLGHLPMVLHPGEPKNAINLGLGAGVTLGALKEHPEIEMLHNVDIEPAAVLVANAFQSFNRNVLAAPALKIFYNDARNFLLTTKNRYDVISSDPFEPVAAGAIHLFTREHFELAKSRLKDDGIVCQWLPMYELSLDDYSALVGTFVSVFPQSLYFSTGADSILIGFNDRVRFDPEKAARRLAQPDVAASLREIGFTEPEQLWSMLIADFTVNPPARPPRLVTDNHPFVEFSAPRTVLEETYLNNRRHQLDLFESASRQSGASPFLSAFDADTRKNIDRQRAALRAILGAGYALAAGDLDSAFASAKEAVALAPAHPLVRDDAAAIYHAAGNVALKTGGTEEALSLLRDAHALQPAEFKYHYRLALAYLRMGDSAAAAPLLATGIQKFPESPFFYSLHGSLSVEANNIPQALAFHKIAVEKAPRLDHLWEQYERAAQLGGNEQALARIKEQRRAFTE